MSTSEPQSSTESDWPASAKERFDLCTAMLKAYYDALESRLGSCVGLFVVVIGWLITSQGARQQLAKENWLFTLALLTLTLVLGLYGGNVARWVRRWRQIREYVDELHYVEPRFYVRYEVPRWLWLAYFGPVALLYAFVIGCLILIKSGRFA